MAMTIFLLLLLGLFLLFAELFVPGGIIGTVGVVMMGAGVWLSFHHYGLFYGMGIFLGCLAAITVTIIVFFKQLPNSRFGRRVILFDSVSKREGYHAESFSEHDLIGKIGVAESDLRPAGIALFEGDRVDVVTEGEFIDNQSRIRVLRIDGNRVVVTQA